MAHYWDELVDSIMLRMITFLLLWISSSALLMAQETDILLPAKEAAATMKVPPGFQVTLFAGEPEVQQPIGFCIDDRSRLWVAEAYSYPVHGTQAAGDRILILEDSDGDGQHDKRTVFFEGLNYVTGIEVGFGGAWVMSPPYFYFIPDRDGDDRPDGAPEVILDGFGNHDNAHNLANGFAWGPDGWLYGTHGRTNWSMIGKPGTPENERVRFDGGVYRYHPVHRVWEPYADGTTNPWGIDWNDYGHAFVCNCVNPHLFQVIQGAHYEPWRGRASSQYAYQRIDTIADHLHFVGLSNVRKGLGSVEEDAAGGGHAHCGTMIYLGDSLPAAYRNTLFTNNIHGRRINNDILNRQGSGYVASHGADLMRSQDPWFMGVTLAYGPAGEIYVSDWSDTGECHSVRNTQRQTGRIYRLTYGAPKRPPLELALRTDAELTELQLHDNDWFVRHARRLLQERSASGRDMSAVKGQLRDMFVSQAEIPKKLRAMWALKVIGGLDEAWLIEALGHSSEDVRAWAVTFLCENNQPSPAALEKFVELAAQGTSALVRLSLASGLQRIAPQERWPIATALAAHEEDQADQNLPLMLWYGCEPLIDADLVQFARLGATAKIARVSVNVARRIASAPTAADGLELLCEFLAKPIDEQATRSLLTGILEGVEGKRRVPMPVTWSAAFERLSQNNDPRVREMAIELAVVFDDANALATLQQLALDSSRAATDRSRAIEALVAKRFVGFELNLLNFVADAAVRSAALRGLANYNHPQTATVILKTYDLMNASDRQTAQATLASRVAWTRSLLDEVEAKRISASELTAYTARQIRSLGDAKLTARLTLAWGELHETPADTAKKIAAIKKWLTAEVMAKADMNHGQQLFKKQCANCHQFFGEGGKIGPDITGAQRSNLDYMLENIVDPNSAVAKDYQMEIVQTADGRVITGLVESANADTVVVQTATERLVIRKEDIELRKQSRVSIMPQGLLEPLSEDDIRDLFAYLQRRQ